jgi:hypothetical protein
MDLNLQAINAIEDTLANRLQQATSAKLEAPTGFNAGYHAACLDLKNELNGILYQLGEMQSAREEQHA